MKFEKEVEMDLRVAHEKNREVKREQIVNELAQRYCFPLIVAAGKISVMDWVFY